MSTETIERKIGHERKQKTDREKLSELINDYFGCDAAYYDVDSYEMADHLISHGVTFEKQVEWKKQWHDNNLIGHEYEECPICGCMISDTEKFWDCNYCPNCGAMMKGSKNA